mmetsp:Transcript_41845/g.100439  ORF Transcript_41845/g.100439 Transcript_41845/m.100439 type:complete len:641 (-) Transcript_41845:141-2063(-)
MSPPPPPPSKTTATATTTTAALATPSRGTEKKTTTEPNNNNNNTVRSSSSSSSTTTKSSLSFTSPPSRTQPSLTRIYPSSSTAMSSSSSSSSSSSLFASSSSSESLSDISINGSGAGTAAVPASTSTTATTVSTAPAAIPKLDPNEPNMYLLPGDLHRYYGPLPFLLQLGTVIVSAMISAMVTSYSTRPNLRQLSLLPLQWLRKISLSSGGGVFQQPWGKIVAFLARFLICTLVLHISIQEIFFPPSRVSMSTLLERYFLPSPLSKYRQVTLPPPPRSSSSSFSTGVHYLEYHNKNLTDSKTETKPSFDALYFQHGFGACSLSWLPAIPSLVERMKAKVAYGHDAPGFGFTDRPNHLRWYTHRASAWIAQQVMNLNNPIAATGNSNTNAGAGAGAGEPLKKKSKTLGLFGHSMGSLTILRLALDLPRDTSKFIVLASPALGIRGIPKKPPKVKTHDQGNRSIPYWIRQKALKPLNKALTNRVLDPTGRYILRRAVGTQGSWRSGLKLAWGDPNKLSESDVARFSWPSIGMGWEQGIINFSRAQMSHVEENHDDHDDEDYELDNDRILMQRVLELPNTKVVVIVGSKDRVVPSQQVRKFFDENFPQVPIVELDGLGHDAFEEGKGTFCDTVERLVDDHWQQ